MTTLLATLQTALQSGNPSDLRQAVRMGTEARLQTYRTSLIGQTTDPQRLWELFEQYDVVTDALLMVRLLLRSPRLTQELLATPEVQGLILDLQELERPSTIESPRSMGAFLHLSGQRQHDRWQQRVTLGLH